jgi:hypothetical protein
VTNAYNLIAFAQSPESDAAYGGVEARNIAASGEDADDAPLGVDVSHNSRVALSWYAKQEIISRGGVFRKGRTELFPKTTEPEKIIE